MVRNRNRLVQFVVGGTQKGGTTALDGFLRSHPEICMSKRKEAHFFDREKRFRTDSVDCDKYAQLFQPKRGQRVLGEATPIYMY